MQKIAVSLLGSRLMMASFAYAGVNGNQNAQGNNGNVSGAGNSDFGQRINVQGQCAGNSHTGTRPKDKGGVMNALCESPFMKKYSPLCQ